MTVADIIMFSHFWKLAWNPKAEQESAAKIKEAVKAYPGVNIWFGAMNMQMIKVTSQLISSPF